MMLCMCRAVQLCICVCAELCSWDSLMLCMCTFCSWDSDDSVCAASCAAGTQMKVYLQKSCAELCMCVAVYVYVCVQLRLRWCVCAAVHLGLRWKCEICSDPSVETRFGSHHELCPEMQKAAARSLQEELQEALCAGGIAGRENCAGGIVLIKSVSTLNLFCISGTSFSLLFLVLCRSKVGEGSIVKLHFFVAKLNTGQLWYFCDCCLFLMGSCKAEF